MDYKSTFRKRNPVLFFTLVFLTAITILQFKTYYFSAAIIIFWLFVEYFYRLPISPYMRSVDELKKLDAKLGLVEDKTLDENAVYSPCYGIIKKIEKTKDHTRIISVLDVTDVHYQFSPFQGELIQNDYKPGQFYIAGLLDKSRYNERNHCIFKRKDGLEVEVIQIAGVLARKIEMLDPKKKKYGNGEPFGLIHFGSRVDTIVPNVIGDKIMKLFVKEGDKLKGFNTKLCVY